MTMFKPTQLIFLIQILTAVLFNAANGSVICSPRYACENSRAGCTTVDPEDCHNYYLCIESEGGVVPSDQPVSCPQNQYYNFKVDKCQNETIPCGNPCLNRNCSTECDANVGIKIVYPGDCNKYYTCMSYDEKVEGQCPDNKPYFDGTECSKDESSCCDVCDPYCEEANTEIRDPYNCKGFYLCFKADTRPTPQQRYECDADMHFDSVSGTCVKDGRFKPECQNLCPGNSTIIIRYNR